MSFIWSPTEEAIKSSNVFRLMNKNGIKSFDELVTKSQTDIDWFWNAVVSDLNIEFFKPYQKVSDSSAGIAWTTWFNGGTTSIAYNCIERWANGPKANKIALIWEGENGDIRSFTYADLDRLINRVANFLISSGFKKGDRAAVFMPMIPEAIIATFGIIKAGGIYIPIFSGYGPDAVASRIQDAEATFVFTCNGFYRKGNEVIIQDTAIEAVNRTASIVKLVIVERLNRSISVESKKIIQWSELDSYSSSFQSVEMNSEDPFMIIYTSGTTGKPKGAVHVHGGFMVKIAEEVAYQTDLKNDDILFWFTDTGWIMAPWEQVGAFALGGTVLCYEGVPDYPAPDRVWDIIERHKVTIFGFSPTAVRALRKHSDEYVSRHNLTSLRILASTGEPWNEEPYKWFFEKIGGGRCPIINLSGGTEVGACFLSPHPITSLKICSLGGPSLGMCVDVFDEDGKPVRGKVGELVCTKPWPGMTRGIWKDPKRFIETYWSRWNDVWVHGDWASIDADGQWYLHGRSDDTIKVAGKRIGPAEVESVITKHPDILEAAVIGVPDELKGESLICFVVSKSGNKTSEIANQVTEIIVSELGKTMKPKVVKFVSALPKTRNAKILRRLIKAKYLNKPLGDTSNLENPSALDEVF